MKTITHIYYVFSGRFPSEKAHALYAAKVCDGFAKQGFTVTLVVPRRLGRSSKPYTEFFQTDETFVVKYIPTIDLYWIPYFTSFAFYIHYCFFSVAASLYCFTKANTRTYFVSNEFMTSLFCSYVSDNVLYEMHDYPKGGKMFFKLLLSRVRHVLTQNTIKRDMLVTEFGVEKESIIVEHNAISVGTEVAPSDALELRAQLGIAPDSFVVMYTGQLLAWKGVHTLAQALAQLGSSVQGIFLGGSPVQVTAFGDQYASHSNIFVLGYKPFFEIPKWQSVADCLVLPNTAHEKISSTYTSPMKLFEYMASKRPIIASDLPSIREIVDETEVFFVQPDDVEALIQQILFVKENTILSRKRAETAYEHVIKNTWEQRAERICTALAIEAL